ncbi:GntR family transcriptional regulator [Morganella morganii]|nr:GntR family transcriptional regulator [Morganella morganii]
MWNMIFSLFLQHRLDQQSTVPLYLQLKQGIEEAITQKQLTHGCVLPSERRLSQSLGGIPRYGGEGTGLTAETGPGGETSRQRHAD